MSNAEIKDEKRTQIEVAIKDETAEHPRCPLCPDPMLPEQSLKWIALRDGGGYYVHASCFLGAQLGSAKPYLPVVRRIASRKRTIPRIGGYKK